MNIEQNDEPQQLWLDMPGLDLVADFHDAFGHPIATTPITAEVLASGLAENRMDFIQEEVDELWEAYRNNDVIAFIDALQDLKYFIYGTELALGIPSEESFNAVHDSNMDKRQPDGTVAYDPDTNKVQKPADWVGPEERLEEILLDAHERGSPFPTALAA